MRVDFEGRNEPVYFPAHRWDDSVAVGDVADATIRKGFLSNGYDGLAISKRPDRIEREDETDAK